MTKLRNILIEADRNGNLPAAAYSFLIQNSARDEKLNDELVMAHNENAIDLIAAFTRLSNSPSGSDFFLTRSIIADILPDLKADVTDVMNCVLHPTREAGQDLSAGAMFGPFIEFCAKDLSRPVEALKTIESDTKTLASLMPPSIVAGARLDEEYFAHEAIRLSKHSDNECKKHALFALGRIEYNLSEKFLLESIRALVAAGNSEEEDSLLGVIATSAFNIYQQDNNYREIVAGLLKETLLKGGDFTTHAASEIFSSNSHDIHAEILSLLTQSLSDVTPSNTATIGNIDYGISRLLRTDNAEEGILVLEHLLKREDAELEISSFKSSARVIYENKSDILDKLLTRWFLLGNRKLCQAIKQIVQIGNTSNISLKACSSEIKNPAFNTYYFLARKIVGYLFHYPITATGLLLSILELTDDETTQSEIVKLIEEPLLINFSGQVGEFLRQRASSKNDVIASCCNAALATYEEYINIIKDVESLPEHHPPQSNRDSYSKHFSQSMSVSMKAAEAESALLSVISKSVLLYGNRSISYVDSGTSRSNRIETALHGHEVSVEIPRMHSIDPFGLDYTLRVFRAEELKN